MPFPNSYSPGQTADEFTAGNPPAQPRDSSVELTNITEAGRSIARARVDLAAGYHGTDSRQAEAAREQLRAATAGPSARSELVPAIPETPSLSHEEAMGRLRRADVASRRQPDHGELSRAISAELRSEFSTAAQTPEAQALEQLRAADPASKRGPHSSAFSQSLAEELRKLGVIR
jgi:hypothetical protein